MMRILAPSILSADFGILGEQLRICDEAGAQYVHIDVMDGMFVPSITYGMPVISSIRPYTNRFFDVHLMIADPDRYLEDFVKVGADSITVHAEACKHLDATIERIKRLGVKAAVAINPATPVDSILHVLGKVDMVLVMTVNPGFGGQSFITYTLDKIRQVAKYAADNNLSYDIQVDGGITRDNLQEVLDAGANVLVSGSSVFKGDIADNVKYFLERM